MIHFRWFHSLCFVLVASTMATATELDVDSLQRRIHSTIESVQPAVVSIGRRGGSFKVDDLPFARMGASASLVSNQPCLSISFPGGQSDRGVPLVRFGRIVRNGRGGRMLQSTALMEPGDSGGPLFDLQGRVIGIHSRIGRSMTRNFEVPVDTFKKFWSELNREQSFTESGPPVPKLGFRGMDRPDGTGINVIEIVENSLADIHGIEPKDVIQTVYGSKPPSIEELRRALIAA